MNSRREGDVNNEAPLREGTRGAFPRCVFLFARAAFAGTIGCAITLSRCVSTYECLSATDVQPTNLIILYDRLFFIFFIIYIYTHTHIYPLLTRKVESYIFYLVDK